VIDLHCHVIARVDDGPATIEDALALCRAARADGTTTIIATPHVNWRYPNVGAGTVEAGVAALKAALLSAGIDLRVDGGAEIALSRAGELSDAEIVALRLGQGPYSLIECPHRGGAPAAIREMLHRFAGSGHSILLAHPERCPVFQSDPRLVPELIDHGTLCCVTARSLTGDFGPRARAYAWDLMEAGHVHAIASDAHGAVGRPPDLASTLDRAGLSASQIEYFARTSPRAIIEGAPLARPPRVEVPRSRRRFQPRLRRARR
jgi:protein-tyrosine phosphatase